MISGIEKTGLIHTILKLLDSGCDMNTRSRNSVSEPLTKSPPPANIQVKPFVTPTHCNITQNSKMSGKKNISKDDLEASQNGPFERIKKMFDPLQIDVTQMKTQLTTAENTLNTLQGTVDTLKNETTNTQGIHSDNIEMLIAENKNLKVQVAAGKTRTRQLESKVDVLESANRRYNIIIKGLDERRYADGRAAVMNLFKDIQCSVPSSGIDGVYRLGASYDPVKGPRPLLVELALKRYRGEIYSKLKAIKTLQQWTGISVMDDNTQVDENKLKDMRATVAVMRGDGLEAKVQNKTLVYNKTRYNHKDLSKLPVKYHMESIKTPKVNDGVAFQSHHSKLSNFYRVDFKYEDVIFSSAEQAYAYIAAVTCEDEATALKILATDDPYKIKKLADNFQDEPDWVDIKMGTLDEIVEAKFTQDKPCRLKLFQTSDDKLWEATGDVIYGCGFSLAQKDQISVNTTKGANETGKILMRVRDRLKDQFPEDVPT